MLGQQHEAACKSIRWSKGSAIHLEIKFTQRNSLCESYSLGVLEDHVTSVDGEEGDEELDQSEDDSGLLLCLILGHETTDHGAHPPRKMQRRSAIMQLSSLISCVV